MLTSLKLRNLQWVTTDEFVLSGIYVIFPQLSNFNNMSLVLIHACLL